MVPHVVRAAERDAIWREGAEGDIGYLKEPDEPVVFDEPDLHVPDEPVTFEPVMPPSGAPKKAPSKPVVIPVADAERN